MADRKLLLVFFLVVAVSTNGVQGQFGSDLWEKTKGFGGDVLGKINAFKDKAFQKFMDALPDKVKEWVGKGDYKNANVTEMVESIPAKAWNVMNLEKLNTMGGTKLDELITKGQGKIPPRILQQLRDMRMSNVTRQEAITKLKTVKCPLGMPGQGCQTSGPVLRAYLRQLGDPAKLTEQNITSFGTDMVLSLPPSFIKRITNKPALKKINEFLKTCLSSTQSGCPPQNVVQSLIDANNMAIYGKQDTWTSQNITDMGGVASLRPLDIRQLSTTTLKDIKSQIVNRNYDPIASRRILKKLAEADMVFSMSTAAEVTAWVNSLGNLKNFVLPSDVPSIANSDASLVDLMLANAKRLSSQKQLNPKDAKTLLKDILKNKSITNMTETDVANAGVLLGSAAPFLLEKLINKKVLKGNNLKNLGDTFMVNGPGSDARGQILKDAIQQEGGTMPSALVGFLSASEMDSMTETQIQNFVTTITANPVELDDAQKSVILKKMVGKENTLPMTLKSMIPFSSYENKNAGEMKALAMGMLPTSAMTMRAASKTFTGNNITLSDINSNMDLAYSMSASDAAKINLGDMPEVMKAMGAGDAPTPMMMDLCIALKERMVMAAKADRDVEDDVEFAQTMTPTDLEECHICVIAALGQEALKSLPPDMMPTLLQKMGKSDYSMSIPRSTRRFIVDAAMKPMRDMKTLGTEVTTLMGTAVYDLPGDTIKKLDFKAALQYISALDILSRSCYKPCLDREQKDAIAMLLTDVHGDPSTWESLDQRCCLLEFMSSTQYNKIPADVLASCTCEMSDGGCENFLDSKMSICESDIGESEMKRSERNADELEKRKLNSALTTLGDLNARRRKRAAQPDSCDTAAIGGIPSLTIDQIDKMSNESVLGCIFELGQMEIEDNKKAEAAFNRIQEAKDNKLDTLTKAEMKDMNFIWKALKPEQVQNLTTLTYGTMDDVVLTLGKYLDLEEEVLQEVAMKVGKDWKLPKDMSARDLTYINQIICGFNNTMIEAINNDALKEAMTTINGLEDCPDEVVQGIATKAMVAYGDPKNWDSAVVNELGKVVGGLPPEKLMTIPGPAFSGLSVEGLESIPPESIKAVKVEQLQNLPVGVAASVSKEQMAEFTEEMREALQNKLNVGSGATGLMTSALACLLAAVALLTVA